MILPGLAFRPSPSSRPSRTRLAAHALLEELRAKWVSLRCVEGRLHVEVPRGVLTPELRAALTAQRDALLEAVQADAGFLGEAPGVEPPVRQLQHEWATAYAKARQGFATHGVEPIPEALEAAARLGVLLTEEPWGYLSPTRDEARKLVTLVYKGELGARIGPDGRVRIASARAERLA